MPFLALISILNLAVGAAPVTGSEPHEVAWTCSGAEFRGKPLTSRFEPGAAIVTWEGSSWRLESVPSDVGARYAVDSEETGTVRFWTRGDRSAFEAGETSLGCRAERRDPDLPMPAVASQTSLDLATALVDGRPRKLSDLTSIVGPIPRDRSDLGEAMGPLVWFEPEEGPIALLWVELQIDLYHHDPRDDEDPTLEDWAVTFRGAGDAVAELLRSRFGEGQELPHQHFEASQFGPFYYIRQSDTLYKLEHNQRPPSWSVPPLGEEEARDEIARVERFLTTGIDRASLEAAFGPLVPDAWHESLVTETLRWKISAYPIDRPFERVFFTPRGIPIPAGRLIRTLGITRPVVVSRDQHWVGRDLEDLETGLPTIGDYRIEVSIDRAGLERLERDPERYRPPTWTSVDFPITGIAVRLRRDR